MNTSNWKKGFVAIMGSGLTLANVVCQAQENVVAEVTFVAAITISEFGFRNAVLNASAAADHDFAAARCSSK